MSKQNSHSHHHKKLPVGGVLFKNKQIGQFAGLGVGYEEEGCLSVPSA